MKRDSLFEKLEIILVIETLVLLTAMINEPTKNAKQPPSVIAPVIKIQSGVKVCEIS